MRQDENKYTETLATTWVNGFKMWQQNKGTCISLPDISPKNLDMILSQRTSLDYFYIVPLLLKT